MRAINAGRSSDTRKPKRRTPQHVEHKVIIKNVLCLYYVTSFANFVVLKRVRIKESGMEQKQYEWYLDLRRHGAVKCSGFSFLFDPLVLYATGLNDVRDAVPFPRSFGKANN